jgi:hypothetical protein
VKELTLSEQLAALPYEAKVRICFRLLKAADYLREAKPLDEPRAIRRDGRKVDRR